MGERIAHKSSWLHVTLNKRGIMGCLYNLKCHLGGMGGVWDFGATWVIVSWNGVPHSSYAYELMLKLRIMHRGIAVYGMRSLETIRILN